MAEQATTMTTGVTILPAVSTKGDTSRVVGQASTLVATTRATTEIMGMTSIATGDDNRVTMGETTTAVEATSVMTNSTDVEEEGVTSGLVEVQEMTDSEGPPMTLSQRRRKIGQSHCQETREWKSKSSYYQCVYTSQPHGREC